MAFTEYTGDTKIIGDLGTNPSERGLTTQQFKDKFDQFAKEFVAWFNATHIAEADAHLAEEATISKLGHVYHATLTTTLDTAWTGTEAPYTKTQTVIGISSNDNPIVDVVMSGTFATDEERANEWGKIYRVTTANDSITLYAMDKPEVSLPIQLKVVR